MERDCALLPSYMESAFPSPPSRTDDFTTAEFLSEAVQDIQTTAHAVALARASHKTYVKAEGTLTGRHLKPELEQGAAAFKRRIGNGKI